MRGMSHFSLACTIKFEATYIYEAQDTADVLRSPEVVLIWGKKNCDCSGRDYT
jgi:hypothetical protein